VLRGAINFKRADVARDVYEKLQASKVEITEPSFTLMIEACVLAKDLKSGSDFLMKMETSGYCPNSELLDKVMDLYSQQKSQRVLEKQGQQPDAPGAPAPAPEPEETLAGQRAKLSSDAPIFVPSFGGEEAPEAELRDRTKLTAAAKPFEPQFNYTFDSCTYTWTPGDAWEEEAWEEEGEGAAKKAEARSKGRFRGRGRGEEDAEAEKPLNGKAKGKPEAEKAEKAKASSKRGRAWKPKEATDASEAEAEA